MAIETTTASLRLPPLPYSENALEPIISARTLSFHHGKHHRSYLETLSKLIAGTELAELSLDELVTQTAGKTDHVAVFNNAAQAWNHRFYWRCLKPKGGGNPPPALKQKMEATYGSVEACKRQLIDSAVTQFGSGWSWLVLEGAHLKVIKTGNADNPITQGLRPLFTIDVWEHAYYLDYQNERARYLDSVLAKLNWNFAMENLEQEGHPVRAAA